MELKNIFKMTKTDRYTQDGRDELAKLQETEDVKYKTGDISQKTGLQKQPDGSWAPPKNAGKNVHGAEIDKIYEKHQKRIKELKAKGYTDEQIEKDKIYQQTKEDMRNVGKSKPAENKPALTQTEFVKQKMEQYKDLSPEQKKDAMYAASYEGITIGGTQNGMERAGWDLVQADDDVNVYAKPDGSKVTMKHDGQKITSSEYEAPGNKPTENKTTIRQGPNFKTLDETPAEHIKKNWDAYEGFSSFDMEELVLRPSGYKETDSYGVMGGGKRVQYEKEGGEKIALFFNENGELDDYEIEKAESKSEEPERLSLAEANSRIKRGITSPGIDTGSRYKNEAGAKIEVNSIGDDGSVNYSVRHPDGTRRTHEARSRAELERILSVNGYAYDSAPRQLTGDCKIRIRK